MFKTGLGIGVESCTVKRGFNFIVGYHHFSTYIHIDAYIYIYIFTNTMYIIIYVNNEYERGQD